MPMRVTPTMSSHSSPKLRDAIKAVHYLYPPLIILYFVVATAVSIVTLKALHAQTKKQQYRRVLVLSLIISIIGSYIIEASTIGIYDAINRTWSGTEDYNIYVLSSVLVWGIIGVSLFHTEFPVWSPYVSCWLLGIIFDIFLIITSNVLQHPNTWKEISAVVLQVLRITVMGVLVCLYLEHRIKKRAQDQADEDPERQPLLRRESTSKTDTTGTGSASTTKSSDQHASTDEESAAGPSATGDNAQKKVQEEVQTAAAAESLTDRTAKETMASRLAKEGNWFTYLKTFTLFWPWIWPVNDKKLQARVYGYMLCLLFSSFMNIAIPYQFGEMGSAIAGAVTGSSNSSQGPWSAVAIYVILTVLNSNGIIGGLRRWLWQPVDQYGIGTINKAAYQHVMKLSSNFHNSKSSAELIQVVRQGQSVKDLVEVLAFEVVPQAIDICVAFIYLYFLSGSYMVLTSLTMVVVFTYVTSFMLARRKNARRIWVKTWREEQRVENEGIEGWHTAAHFGRIEYETQRFDNAVQKTCETQITYANAAFESNFVTRMITTVGITVALYISVYQVVVLKTKTLANFITLVSYWDQVTNPLDFFAQLQKKFSEYVFQTDQLLDLFQVKPTVFDAPNAKPLEFRDGAVSFHGVDFGYDERKSVLKDISFDAPGGATIALVGETGGGKSTMLKLLFRFWDVKAGKIEIDGQDISQVTLESLQSIIGTVPQDPSLFNGTIMENIRYAKLDATDEEIYEACRGAAVHDKILSLPDGYKSTVGDRGVKLSGGEKQRIAIARAMLMNPKMILLDEATSAVDTDTEAHIQEALAALCKGRTTFVVAHRLSTIIKADLILVLEGGSIIERGSHHDLVEKKGKYHSLWSKQTHAFL